MVEQSTSEEVALIPSQTAPDALRALRVDLLCAMYASVRERGNIDSPEVEATLEEIRMVKATQGDGGASIVTD